MELLGRRRGGQELGDLLVGVVEKDRGEVVHLLGRRRDGQELGNLLVGARKISRDSK